MALIASLRHISMALLILGAGSSGVHAGDAVPKDDLPPNAKRALSVAEDAITKARATFAAAAAKEQDKLLVALQREQESQTKAGKLEAALAVKAAADKVRSGDYLRELDEQANASSDLLGDGNAKTTPAPSLARLAGHWRMIFSNEWRRMVRVEPDGRIAVIESNNVEPGTTYTVHWDEKSARFVSDGLGNMIETYRIDGDRILCDHWCDRTKYPAEGPSLTAQFERPQPPGPGQGPDRPQRPRQAR
jgi:hypothetical protein